MAATAHPALAAAARPARHSNFALRGIVLWHLLSLDAPTVAMLWTWFLARASHVRLPATATLAMGSAVWMLYAADRLLDTRAISSPHSGKFTHPDLEPRHYFHRQHQRAFRWGILLVSIALAFLLPQLSPQSIRLYLVLGTLLFGYFILIHVSSEATQAKTHRLPKELAVGVFFSAATFIPTVSGNPSLRPSLLPGAILFAVLCSLNCLFIYAWEHPQTRRATHPATSIALRFLPHLSIIVTVTGLILVFTDRSLPRSIPSACALAAALLSLLHLSRRRLSLTTLRAAADLCLLTPLLLLRF